VLREQSPGKTADVEILDGNQTKLGGKASGQLMGMVIPDVANPLMLPG